MPMRYALSALSGLLAMGLMVTECASAERRTSSTARQTSKTSAKPPAQPAKGPGSRDYPHGRVSKKQHGEGAQGYWLFTPADPTPQEAPVVLFLHGWRATNPRDYGAWIDHLARRGNIVIYPIFEATRTDEPEQMMNNAIRAAKRAIEELERSGPIRPRLDRFAIVGHSLGGGLTAQIAARAKAAGLPAPRAIMPAQPGWRGKGEMPTDKLDEIPASVLMLVVVGGDDQFAKNRQDKAIFKAATQVPKDRKAYVVVPSDHHGDPPLIADHSSPLAPDPDYGADLTAQQARRRGLVKMVTGMRDGEVDALDYLGYWKLFDALCEAAFAGKNIDAVVGSGDALALGAWSDGTPVKRMVEAASP